MRTAAVVAMGKLGLKEAIPDLTRMLRDDDENVALNAVESLVALGARSSLPEIDRLRVGGMDVDMALLKLGRREAVGEVAMRVLDYNETFLLNAVRSPAVWARLEGRTFVRRPEDTIRDSLERMAREAGMPLEWPKMSKEQEEYFSKTQWQVHEPHSGPALQRSVQGRSSLLRALERSAADAWFAVVLETDRIRLLDYGTSRGFWKEWWKEEREK